MPNDLRALFDKIQALPPERVAQIEDFVDFIASRVRQDRALVHGSMAASTTSFATMWENPEDEAYNAL